MTIPADAEPDHFDRLVDFGGYHHDMFFDPRSSRYRPMPPTPPPRRTMPPVTGTSARRVRARAGTSSPRPAGFGMQAAGCATAPATGSTTPDRGRRERLPCHVCRDAWKQDVGFFRDAPS